MPGAGRASLLHHTGKVVLLLVEGSLCSLQLAQSCSLQVWALHEMQASDVSSIGFGLQSSPVAASVTLLVMADWGHYMHWHVTAPLCSSAR